MKKFLFSLIMSLMCVSAFAQKEVQVKAGTIIPLRATNTVAAADVKAGDKVLFTVARDVNIDGVTAIPYGTSVSGIITLAKKSSWWGTKGRLSLNVTELVMPNGTVIPLENGMVQIQGKIEQPCLLYYLLLSYGQHALFVVQKLKCKLDMKYKQMLQQIQH